ncbi:MAG: coproporphyrinogen-III oxidase family protein [Acidobacteriota bacterium]
MSESTAGLYVHVPFCAVRCDYCNFAIVAGQDRRIPAYLEALSHEAAVWGARLSTLRFDTLHFGGGTPSRLTGDQIDRLIQTLASCFSLRSGAEIALEANPEDVSPDRVRAWRAAGVTRITVGVQSRRKQGLQSIGRPGTVHAGDQALIHLAEGGIESLGVDLIFGRPEQSVTEWSEELDEVLAMPVQHLSLYALETDGKSPLALRIERGDSAAPSSDDAAAMYEAALSQTNEAGFSHYEISNFARPGHVSRHNLKYWTDSTVSWSGTERSFVR